MKLLYDHSTHSLITPTGATFATLDPNVTAREGQWVADEIERASGIDDVDPNYAEKLEEEVSDLENKLEKAIETANDYSNTIELIINEIDTVFLDMDAGLSTFEDIEAAINEILKPHR